MSSGSPQSLARRVVSEALATALLVAVVIGSGIMGERLSAGNTAVALLANTLATGAGLVMLILTFGPISGAHMNPVVTVADASQGNTRWRDVPHYVVAQVLGGLAGAACAHLMFGHALFFASHHVRAGGAQLFSEFVATFGLLAVIWGTSRSRPAVTPFAVAAYITSAYWFTASTSFANPAVTLARAASDTFAGIRPADAPGFIAAQAIGAAAATLLFRWLVPKPPAVQPHLVGSDIAPRRVMKTVLFACVHNAGRSQMAAAWFNALANPAVARAISAGTEPGTRVHPEVLEAMKEVGIDLSNISPTLLTHELAASSSLLVTMGCGEKCPVVPGLKRDDWPLEDPKGKPMDVVRGIRDDVRARIEGLLSTEGWARTEAAVSVQ
jgi:glycerol uptake facilitator-like aquaporin/protein-tyrosine-phosphatase